MTIRALKILAVSIGLTLIIGLAMAGISAGAGPAGIILVPVVFGISLLSVILISAAGAARGRRAWTILASIQQAVQNNLPLPRIVHAISQSERGTLARQMQDAHDAIETGAPVAVVLSTIPQIPERIIRLVVAAERVGRLPQVLQRIIQQRRSMLEARRGKFPLFKLYPLLLLVIYISVSALFFVFVMPKFEAIFKDFGLRLPKATISLLQIAHQFGAILLPLAGVLFFVMILLAVASWWPGAASGLVEELGGWLLNRAPLIGRWRMQMALGELLEFAADAVEVGRPLDSALDEASQIIANSRLRGRINLWIQGLRGGASPADAARTAGMPSLLCGMIASTAHTPDLGAVFRFLGRYYSDRFSRAMAILEASLLPIMAIVMGTLVGWLILGIFLPVIALINKAGNYPIGI